jgi:RHS repeat-associated protein
MRRVAGVSVLVLVFALLSAASLRAQIRGGGVQPNCVSGCGGGGPSAPVITWLQPTGAGIYQDTVYTPTPTLQVDFCDNNDAGEMTGRYIALNQSDVTSSFDYEYVDDACPGGHMQSTSTSLTVSLGWNTLYAYICNSPSPCNEQTIGVYYALPPVVPTGPVVARDLCLTIAVGPGAAYECGDLRIVHALPAVRTLGKVRAPTLLYNSQHAHPFVSLNADVTQAVNSSDSIIATARLKTGGSFTEQNRRAWSGSQWGGSGGSVTRRVMTNVSATTLSTGIYAYQLEIGKRTSGNYTAIRTDTGSVVIVNRGGSAFGAGWWLAGFEQLIAQADGSLLWIDGAGDARRYVNAGTWSSKTWYVARQLGRPDSLWFDGTTYTRLLRGGDRVLFNSSGFHTQTISRLGYATQFALDGSNRLSSITVPPSGSGLTYYFDYNGANATLSAVRAPDTLTGANYRTTSIGTSGSRIASITDPGASASVQFAYGNSSYTALVTARTDRRGATTSYSYGTGLKLVATSLPVSGAATIARAFCPAETHVFDCGGLASPDSTYTVYDGPRTDSSDVTHFWLDSLGAVASVRDAYGYITTITRGDSRWPGLPTQVQATNGFVTQATYDQRGNLATSTAVNPLNNSQNATTSYSWDQSWDQLTQITLPTGQVTQFGVGSSNGNRLWVQDGRGLSSRTVFGYVTAGNGAGLPDSITVPGGALTTLTYNSLGNVASSASPLGWTSYFDSDALGRPKVTRTPLGPYTGSGTFRNDTTAYDAMGRVIRATSANTVDATRLTVANTYDAEGNLTGVDRSGYPAVPGGTLTMTWSYDAANRPIVASATDGAADSTFYDSAGNAVRVATRRGHSITMSYDRLNRLSRRALPTVTYDSITRGLSGTYHGSMRPYPWFPNSTSAGYTIAGDTATFAYDSVGNLVAADNGDAHVRRGYFNAGQVRWDSLFTRTITGTDFTVHKYGLSYIYDLAGRIVTLRHPHQLALPSSSVADTVRYGYDSQTGDLTDVYDLQNNHFGLLYNLRGELIRTSMPGSVFDTLGYDSDGRLTHDRVRQSTSGVTYPFPYATIRDAAFSYSDPARVHQEANGAGWLDTVVTTYNGLGQLTRHQYERRTMTMLGTDQRMATDEWPGMDALANVTNSSVSTNLSIGNGYSASSTPRSTTNYFTSAGRLRKMVDPNTRTDSLVYNGAGDLEFLFSVPGSQYPNSTQWFENRASFYDAAGHMRAAEWRKVQWLSDGGSGHQNDEGYETWYLAFDEYRYDALGRRILARTRKECNALGWNYPVPCALGTITRTVWDGSRELWEIRMPSWNAVYDSAAYWENDTTVVELNHYAIAPNTDYYFDNDPVFGRVGYTHGPALDQPLSITRFAYRDRWWEQGYNNPYTWAPFTVVPHWNWRGQSDYGLFADGEYMQCQSGANARCIKTRGRHRAFAFALEANALADSLFHTYAWLGSLVSDKENGTGTLYRRHRYFDPLTGQFTQEDPAGLAGGMNLYGFGGGDPVSFSDPFGLRVCARSTLLQHGIETAVNASVSWDAKGCAGSLAQVQFHGQRLDNLQRMFSSLVASLLTFDVKWNNNDEPDALGRRGHSFTSPDGHTIMINPRDLPVSAPNGFGPGYRYQGMLCSDWSMHDYDLPGLIAHELGHAATLSTGGFDPHRHGIEAENAYHQRQGQADRCLGDPQVP